MNCPHHPDVEVSDSGSCSICGWQPKVTGHQVGSDIVFTSEPTEGDVRAAQRRGAVVVYQCCRCSRHFRAVRGNDQNRFELVLFAGKYFCQEHYQLERLERHYDEKNPFPSEWREQAIALVIARHPEWSRGAEESRTQYADRMIDECAKLNPDFAEKLRRKRARDAAA